MELIWYSGLSLWFLSFVRCQDNYQPSTFHDYDQEYAPGTQGLQYDPSDTHYPLSSRQNNLLPVSKVIWSMFEGNASCYRSNNPTFTNTNGILKANIFAQLSAFALNFSLSALPTEVPWIIHKSTLLHLFQFWDLPYRHSRSYDTWRI